MKAFVYRLGLNNIYIFYNDIQRVVFEIRKVTNCCNCCYSVSFTLPVSGPSCDWEVAVIPANKQINHISVKHN